MNRWLMAAVIGLTIAGCAEGVEDPQPGPDPDPVQKEPPVQTFSGDLNPITENQRIGVGGGAPVVPGLPNQDLPVPMPGQD